MNFQNPPAKKQFLRDGYCLHNPSRPAGMGVLPGRLPNRRRAIGLRSAPDGHASTRHPDFGPWRRAMRLIEPSWRHWPTRRWQVFSRPGCGEIKRVSPTRAGKTPRCGGAVAKRCERCGVRMAATQMWAPLRVCRRRFSAEISGFPAATQTRWMNGVCRRRKMRAKKRV